MKQRAPFGVFAKLRGRSILELSTRARQLAAVTVERAGSMGHGRELTDAALFRAVAIPEPLGEDGIRGLFCAPGRRCAVPGWDDPGSTAALLRTNYPKEEAALHQLATGVLDGRIDLLGYAQLGISQPIDWHLDPIRGMRSPRTHWSRVPYLDASIVGDHKLTWELNRHRHLVLCAQASLVSGDERFAQRALGDLESWIDANPPKIGINWASSLEIALRSIAWLWTLHLLRQHRLLTGQVLTRALKVLLLNGRHLRQHLSTYFAPNTHLTGEALALMYLGASLPWFKEAAGWCALGRSVLEQELVRQVRPDGTYYEQSTWYQRYTADFYLHALLLSARSTPLSPALRERIAASVKVVAAVARADGSSPLLGDDDGGRLLSLTAAPVWDCRPTLATATVLLGLKELAPGARRAWAEVVWLTGEEAPAVTPGAQRSQVLPDGGLGILRNGTQEGDLLVFDAGVHGTPRTNFGHSHADALSIDLTLGGHPVVVDPGTFTYVGDRALRDFFRSGGAHNAVVVDNRPSCQPAGPFRWETMADARLTSWSLAGAVRVIGGTVTGFGVGGQAVSHQREVIEIAGLGWLIWDRLSGPGIGPATISFHLGAGSHAVPNEGGALISYAGQYLTVRFGSQVDLTIEEGWVSSLYGARHAAPVLRAVARPGGAAVVDMLTALVPGQNPVLTCAWLQDRWYVEAVAGSTEWNLQLQGHFAPSTHAGVLSWAARSRDDGTGPGQSGRIAIGDTGDRMTGLGGTMPDTNWDG